MLKLYLSNTARTSHRFARAGLKDAPDCALFWDCPSLFQPDRDEEQATLFSAGLRASNFWYGHSQSIVWMQTVHREGFAERMRELGLAETYEGSGW